MTEIKELKSVGPVSLKRLTDAGVVTLQDLLLKSPQQVKDITNDAIDLNKAFVLIQEASNLLQSEQAYTPKEQNAMEIWDEDEKKKKLNTGCNNINQILEGGLEEGSTTEIYGEFGAGKTQFINTLMVMAQLPIEQGGLDGEVLIIDTERSFKPKRLRQIILDRKLVPIKEQTKEEIKDGVLPTPEDEEDVKKFIRRITVYRPNNSADQQNMIDHFSSFLQRHPNVRLLIIDSVSRYFRSEHIGRGLLSARQNVLLEHMNSITKLTDVYKFLVVVWTSQVSTNPDSTQWGGDPIRPVGGNIVAHASSLRFYFKKAGKKHIAQIRDSSWLAGEEAIFSITRAGIEDYVDKK